MEYKNISATSDNEKTNLFADYFQNEVYFKSSDTLPFDEQITRRARNIKNNIKNTLSANSWKKITIKEVKWNIKQFRNSSTDPDNIHNRYLKKSYEITCSPFNKSF